MKNFYTRLSYLSFIAMVFTTFHLNAQFGILNKIGEKVQEKVEQKVEKEVEEEIDETIDGKKKEEPKKKEQDKKEIKTNGKETELKKELEFYSKFDFIPGENVLWFEDFANDEIANFPARWNSNGMGEVVTVNNFHGKWLKIQPSGAFDPEIPFTLPRNFTFECDIIPVGEKDHLCFQVDFASKLPDERIDALVPGKGGFKFELNYGRASADAWKDGNWSNVSFSVENEGLTNNWGKKIHISVWVQEKRFRLYVDQNKIADIQRLVDTDLSFDRIRFPQWGCEEGVIKTLLSNIRIANSEKDNRNKLITEGKIVTNGITFDVNSDKIKPESFGVIKEIAQVLKDNPTVKIKIVGHTDSDGKPDANLLLSQKRASSVKNALVEGFSIDASRISIDGKGDTVPVAANDNSVNKAKNRRVEFIKM